MTVENFCNLDEEARLLGTIIFEGLTEKRWSFVFDILKAEHFYYKTHQIIYKEMENRAKEGYIDDVSLKVFFVNNIENGGAYLSWLMSKATFIMDKRQSAKNIVDLWRKREFISIASNSANDLKNKDFNFVISKFENSLLGITANSEIKKIKSIGEIVKSFEEQSINEEFIPTGFETLDNMLNGGFYKQQLIVLGARPSVGKTTFAQNIMLNVATNNKKCFFLSLEIGEKNVMQKFLALVSNISGYNIQRNIGTNTQAYQEAKNKLSKLPIYIDDSSQVSISQIKRAIKRQIDLYGVDLVVVDYIQIVKGDNVFNKSEATIIKDITSSLKSIAKDYNISILALAQINRKGVEGEDKKPNLNDFKGSGGIEEDADVAIILHRKRDVNSELQYLENKTEIIIAKNRYGESGIISGIFDGKIGKFIIDEKF